MDNMGLAAVLGGVIAAAEHNIPHENEYMGEDGLLRCKVCGGPKQTIVQLPFGDAQPRVVRCACDCVIAAQEREKERERREEIERRRRICFNGTNMAGWTFKNDDRQRPDLSDGLAKYAEKFKEYRRDGRGLLLWGEVGTGKTYFAAAIANKVIDQGHSVFMTNFAAIGNALQSTWEKQEYIDGLLKYDLLIIDDLGAERKSEYMQEIVFNVIDARYRDGGPMIITTNLTADELSKPDDVGYSRIYDRVLERCLAVKVDGRSRRRKSTARDWPEMRRQLGMEATT